MTSNFRSFVPSFISIVSACLGAAVAGPLGGAVGGALGGAIGGPFAKLLTDATKKAGEEAGTKLLDAGTDSLLERLKEGAPDLEGLYRDALRGALGSLHGRLDNTFADDADWFTHWDACLLNGVPLKLPPVGSEQLVPGNLDPLFQSLLEDLDAQGEAMLEHSISLSLKTRTLPAPLFAVIISQLPPLFKESFDGLLVTEHYEQAWKEVGARVEEAVLDTLRSIKEDTTQIKKDTTGILAGQAATDAKVDAQSAMIQQILEISLASAQKEKRLSELEAKLAQSEAEKEKFKKSYQELIQSDPSSDDLVKEFGLDGALDRKLQQASKEDSERARTSFEIGLLQELRFDLVGAYKAFRQAWELEKKPEYGFRYARAAQGQNRNVEATGIYEQLLKLQTDEADLALTRLNLGSLFRLAQRTKDAEDTWSNALAAYQALEPSGPNLYRDGIAKLENNLGIIYSETQRFAEAEKSYVDALALWQVLAKEAPAQYLGDAASTLVNLAGLYTDRRRREEADKKISEAIGTYRILKLIDAGAYRFNLLNLASALNNRGVLYTHIQLAEKAETDFNDSLAICNDLVLANPEAYEPQLALTLDNFGLLYTSLKRMEDAEAKTLEALRIRRKLAKVDPEANLPQLAMVLHHLGGIYREMPDQAKKSEDSYIEARDIRIDLATQHHEFIVALALTLVGLAGLYAENKRYEEARDRCQEAGAFMEPLWPTDPVNLADEMAKILWTRALLCGPLGEPDSMACGIVKRALGIARDASIQLSLRILRDDFCGKTSEVVEAPPAI